MYTPTMTLTIGTTGYPSNGTIEIVDIGTNDTVLNITTPWGELYTGGTTYMIVGDIATITKILSYPSRRYAYIVKLLSISPNTSATFQVMSFAYDYSHLHDEIGRNLLTIEDNLPADATPGATVNYSIRVTNISAQSILFRYIFATNSGSPPTIRDSQALPPITYTNVNCWYNNWALGECPERTLGPGVYHDITGNITMPSSGGLWIRLGAFIYVSNYWGTGRSEYVAVIYESGYENMITVNPCTGIVCDPTYICDGCDSYYNVCDPANPTGSCIRGPLKQVNDPVCTSDGYIYISSTPSGATILVDGYEIGTTGSIPVIVKVATNGNPHNVELRLINYETWIDNNVNVSCTAPVIISQVLTPPAPYELHLKLGSATLASYVLSTLNKFTDIFGNALSTMVPGIMINSVTYVQADHEIVIEMQSSSLGMYYQSPYTNNLYYYPNNLNYYPNNLNYYPNNLNLNNYHIQTLIGPLLLLLLPVIPALIVVILLWLGFDIPFFSFRKKATSINTEVHITTCLSISESTCVIPPEDVIIKFNGETKTANATNSYTVTFSNVKATTDTAYPVEAYIPLSAGSNVYKASYKNNILVLPPRTDESIKLKINQSQERDYAPPCPLKYPDNTQVPEGTNIKVMHILKDENGVTEIEEYGIRIIKANGCIDPVKVPIALTDNMLDYQVIPKDVDPNSPDSTPVPGDTGTINRYIDVKNKVAIFTYSTLNNDITVDRIDIKNLNTGNIIKTISGADVKSGYNDIDGIPSGTYQAIITKSGYNLLSCSSNCTIEFTAEYLQSVSFVVILEALVTTCDVSIYILDKDGKELKTIPSVKMCKDSICQGYTITTGKKLDLKEIAEGSYKFTITADKYKTVTDQSKSISCTDPQLIFKVDPTGEDIIPPTMELTVNDLKGSVSVAKNTPFTVKVTGANPEENVEIKNISTIPDTLLTSGLTDASGFFETSSLSFDTDTTFDIQALQGCGVLVCNKYSNIIPLKVGAGAKECLVPNPLGGCLVTKETAVGIGTFILAALFGVAALGIVFMRSPTGRERVIVTAPSYPGGPPQTMVRETTQTVLGKAMEK